MKRLLPPVAVSVVLFVGLLFAAEMLVSPDMVRRRFVEEFTAWTGWTVKVGGEVKVAFFPVPSFTLAGVSIAGTGTDGADLAEVPEIRSKFKLLPLLAGRIEAREIQLTGPLVHLAVDKAGRANWEIGEGLAKLATTGRAAGESAADAIRPGSVAINGGAVRFTDARSGRDSTATDVDFTLFWRSLREPANASAAFTLGDERLEAMGTFASPLAYFSGGVSPLRFAAGGPLVHVVFNGRASNLAGLQLDGEVAANTPSLRRLIGWAGHPLPSGATLGPASIKGQARWLGSTLAFNGATLEVDGNRATGSLDLVTGIDRPALDGALAFETIDFTPYAEAALAHLNAKGRWQEAPAEIAGLSAIDVDLHVSARRVVVGTAQFGPADLTANLSRGRLGVTLGDLGLYRGRVQGRLSAHCAGGRLIGDVELAFDQVPIRPLLSDLAGLDSFDGFATGSLVLNSHARDWGGLLSAATGSGTVSIGNASLTGIDLGRASAALLQVATGARRDAVTTFATINADLTLGEGVVRATALTAAGPSFTVALDGRASLLRPAIAAKGTLGLARAAGEAAVELPFLVDGTWRQPSLAPDFERLRRRTAIDATAPGAPMAALE